MPALKSYNDFYEDGNAVRKSSQNQEKKSNISTRNRRYGKNRISSKVQAKSKKNTLVVSMVLVVFAMSMIITYRYSLISEKNLKVQKLKSSLASVEAKLLNKQIEIEQKTDLNKIEAYDKQQLGMQKPDQSQTVYIDTSKSIQMVEKSNDTTSINSVIDTIKNFFSSIF